MHNTLFIITNMTQEKNYKPGESETVQLMLTHYSN